MNSLRDGNLLNASPSFAPGELLIGLNRTDVADFYVDHGLSELTDLDMGDRILRLVATPTAPTETLLATLAVPAITISAILRLPSRRGTS